VPPPVHPLTYQVRPFTALLLHTDTWKEEEDEDDDNNKKVTLFFACRSDKYADLFFLSVDGGNDNKKTAGAAGMKVDNMHEFVKKINDAALRWLGCCTFFC